LIKPSEATQLHFRKEGKGGKEEVIIVNRKILLTVLTLAVVLLATPYIGMVSAGKGQEKLSIRFQVGASSGTADPGKRWWSPPNGIPPLEVNVLHYRDTGWGIDSTGFLVVVDEGGPQEETFDEEITYSCEMDLNMFFTQYPQIDATIKIRELWVIESRGYIETVAVEILHNYGTPDYYGAGTFVGHGVIDGEKIVISGEAGASSTGPFRLGIVMGWPT
jgi:hypothetical protein